MSSCVIKTSQLLLFIFFMCLKVKATYQFAWKLLTLERFQVKLAGDVQDSLAYKMPSEYLQCLHFLFAGGSVSGNAHLLWVSIKCLFCSFQLAQVRIALVLISFACSSKLWVSSSLVTTPLSCHGTSIIPESIFTLLVPRPFPCFHSNFQ